MGSTLFAFTIFASAFLLFSVQPMVGKRILPWFGGSPGVWSLCLAFYQFTLFLGYSYAHLLGRFVAPRRQFIVHAALFGLALAVLPVLPEESWKPQASADPTGRILAMLCSGVAAPFLMLAATGTLVQVWFARRFPGRSPYPLYAVSNLGSLSALVAYPFLVEPSLPLTEQSRVWTLGFIVTGLVVLWCAWLARAGAALPTPEDPADSAGPGSRPAPSRIVLWLLLPCCAVALMMGVTSRLCLDIASVPFLWIVPLALYLTTFIACFGFERLYRRSFWAALAALAVAIHFGIGEWSLGPQAWNVHLNSLRWQVFDYSLLLFAGCMLLHGELYRLRPPASALSGFYLCISGGGALGGLFVGILAPRIFSEYHELSFAVAGCGVLWLAACGAGAPGRSGGMGRREAWGAVALTTIAAVAFAESRRTSVGDPVLSQERNFFGILRVQEHLPEDPQRHRRSLWSGTTMHGQQFVSPRLRRLATRYYGSASAIGFLFGHMAGDEPIDVGVVGLGIGTLAAYGRPVDRFIFYELDPDVIRIARDDGYFSYLAESPAAVEIVQGDARLSLEAELAAGGGHRFDLLVIDAFNSDAIPVHLLTEEAFRLYQRHLAPDGFLALHISNRQLDLGPLVLRVARTVGMDGVEFLNLDLPQMGTSRSKWVILSSSIARIQAFARFTDERARRHGLDGGPITVRHLKPHALSDAPLWTDDYSDLFGVLKSRGSR